MQSYFTRIEEGHSIYRKAGSDLAIPPEFHLLASNINAQCNFIQATLQHIIFATHGPELLKANSTLKEFPNPKARIEFLCSFPYSKADPIVFKVFEHAKILFGHIYGIRNVLAHEIWSTSDDFPGSVVFSSLEEEARHLKTASLLLHEKKTSPEEIFEANIRLIRKLKVVSVENLANAINDANLCSWALMVIRNILDESDKEKRDELRRGFLIFEGTSHLFSENALSADPVQYSSSKLKTIRR